ncbi:A/G-specific adenine glycosylase [Roseivirga thermotolerans]|uniref:A/G-specific adenine glycosylase n=1 Tax=Roseivirga thermotolerans TaxID=1758176 RepID=UPI0027402251|nr:A/G-specific adenine glycosylase [Roseivirga thermotolerans]
MEREIFVNQLIRWYGHQKRDLPWRETRDPYKIWLSEIILQQTRVNQGMPYYLAFIERYPTVELLAKAPEQEVLRLWQGLGYYSRARNLHACAQTIVEQYHGCFPDTFDELLRLKGIGRYTAAAIASLAFNKPTAVVDGNVYRVLARVFGLYNDISESKTLKIFEQLANELIPANNAAEYNQAIMDFGATQCTPKNPACDTCPLHTICFAQQHGEVEKLPVKSRKTKVKKLYFDYFMFEHGQQILMHKRLGKDIWQGLYQFYLKESKTKQKTEECLKHIPLIDHIHVQSVSSPVRHLLSHREIFARFFRLRVNDLNTFVSIQQELNLQAYSLSEVQDLPKPILIQNYLKSEMY